jgi:hypothetical protein
MAIEPDRVPTSPLRGAGDRADDSGSWDLSAVTIRTLFEAFTEPAG